MPERTTAETSESTSPKMSRSTTLDTAKSTRYSSEQRTQLPVSRHRYSRRVRLKKWRVKVSLDKGNPAARRERKVTGLYEAAGLPKVVERDKRTLLQTL